jgi:hypothetical protein
MRRPAGFLDSVPSIVAADGRICGSFEEADHLDRLLKQQVKAMGKRAGDGFVPQIAAFFLRPQLKALSVCQRLGNPTSTIDDFRQAATISGVIKLGTSGNERR